MKKNIIMFILGCVFTLTITVGANILYKAEDISYNDSNVQDAIGNIYNINKTNLITALNNKGLELENNSTYGNIVEGINSLPIGKTESGDWGYKEDDEVVSFGKKSNINYVGTYVSTDNANGYVSYTSNFTGKVIVSVAFTSDYWSAPYGFSININGKSMATSIISDKFEGNTSNKRGTHLALFYAIGDVEKGQTITATGRAGTYMINTMTVYSIT